jgi:D-3-phosphoglycerate dehydrogenase
MVQLALAGDFVPYAVNVSAGEVSETVRPYQALAEKLGALYAGLAGAAPSVLEIEYQGQIAEYDTRILTLSVLKGFFGVSSDTPVSYVNAPQLADERGIEVRPTMSTTSRDYVNIISIRGGDHSVAGTLTGLASQPKVVMIDDHRVDIPPAPHMVVVRNADTPGMIGRVGTVLGDAGINISDMVVGQSSDGVAALMVLAVDRDPDGSVVEDLLARPDIESVAIVSS